MTVIWFLIVGVLAGWLAGLLVKGGGFGLIGDLVVGILGALIGACCLAEACWAVVFWAASWLPCLAR